MRQVYIPAWGGVARSAAQRWGSAYPRVYIPKGRGWVSRARAALARLEAA